jgi:hypothetical protein
MGAISIYIGDDWDTGKVPITVVGAHQLIDNGIVGEYEFFITWWWFDAQVSSGHSGSDSFNIYGTPVINNGGVLSLGSEKQLMACAVSQGGRIEGDNEDKTWIGVTPPYGFGDTAGRSGILSINGTANSLTMERIHKMRFVYNLDPGHAHCIQAGSGVNYFVFYKYVQL